jgi:hypothetical protein
MSNHRKRTRSFDLTTNTPRTTAHTLTIDEVTMVKSITSLRAQHEDLTALNLKLQHDVLTMLSRLETSFNILRTQQASSQIQVPSLVAVFRNIIGYILEGFRQAGY